MGIFVSGDGFLDVFVLVFINSHWWARQCRWLRKYISLSERGGRGGADDADVPDER